REAAEPCNAAYCYEIPQAIVTLSPNLYSLPPAPPNYQNLQPAPAGFFIPKKIDSYTKNGIMAP
ncbi:hypothetical protein NP590_20455, partial [Methylomonas sp. SURF-2]